MKKIIRLTESDLARIVRKVIKEQNDDFWNQYTSNGTAYGEVTKNFKSVPYLYMDGTSQLTMKINPNITQKYNIGAHLIAKYSPLSKTPSDRFKYSIDFFLTKKEGQDWDQGFFGVNSTSIRGGTDDKYGYVFAFFRGYVDDKTKKWVYTLQFEESTGSPESPKFAFPGKTNTTILKTLLFQYMEKNFYGWVPSSLTTQINTELESMGFPTLPKLVNQSV